MRSIKWLAPAIVAILGIAGLLLLLIAGTNRNRQVAQTADSSGQSMQMSASPYKSLLVSSSSTASAVPVSPNQSPTQVTQKFYDLYIACLKKGTVAATCQTSLPNTADTFNQNMAGKVGAGADPIVCAQNLPDVITIGRESIIGNLATTYAIEKFGGSQHQILVDLSSDTGQWLITNITCPRP